MTTQIGGAEARRRKRIDRKDVRIVLYLPLLIACAWLLPHAAWPAVARGLAALPRPLRLPMRRPAATVPNAAVTLAGLQAHQIEAQFHYLRSWRPLGWRPPLRLTGMEHLEAAGERGAVLWVAYTAFASLIAKQALAEAGVRVLHLSRPGHGLSLTIFGARVLNRLHTRIEDRFLAQRIVVEFGHEQAATRRLREALAAGEIVSITAYAPGGGRQELRLPFQGGMTRLATGAPALAHATGAPLLPVFVVRDEAGIYQVAIEPPLQVDRSRPRRAAVQATTDEMVARHEPWVAADPTQWKGFAWLEPA